jgi:hypothetical protein
VDETGYDPCAYWPGGYTSVGPVVGMGGTDCGAGTGCGGTAGGPVGG